MVVVVLRLEHLLVSDDAVDFSLVRQEQGEGSIPSLIMVRGDKLVEGLSVDSPS